MKVLLFTILLCHICSSQPTPKFSFIHQPSDITTRPRHKTVLPCQAQLSSRAQLVYRWKKDGQILNFLPSDNHYRLLTNGSLLIVNPTRQSGSGHSDKGIYHCLVSFESKVLVSRKARVRVAFISHRLLEQPKDMSLGVGDTALLRCKVLAVPVARVIWFKGTERLVPSDKITIWNQGVLEISNLNENDFGTYRCRTSNSEGFVDSRGATISKASSRDPPKPHFTMKPDNITVAHQGDDITLFCSATGLDSKGDKPTITWIKDESVVVTQTRDLSNQLLSGSLQIPKVLQNDAGTYTCTVNSADGSMVASTRLVVMIAPYFIEKPTASLTSKLNANVLLRCDVGGFPDVKPTWLKDGEMIHPSDYFQIVDEKHLKILGVLSSDEGMYQCFGDNQLGSIESTSQLTVINEYESTTPHYESATFVQFGRDAPSTPTSVISTRKSSTSITLQWTRSSGKGPITYIVYYKELDESRESSIRTMNSHVEITGLKSANAYRIRVVASNIFGLSASSASVLAETANANTRRLLPGVPIAVRLKVTSSRRIAISWIPPMSRTPIQLYQIEYAAIRRGLAGQKQYRISTNSQSTLVNLSPYTEYEVSISAKNTVGYGPTSLVVRALTFSSTPSAPPSNISIQAESSDTITLSWQPPPVAHRNGVITGYRIQYRAPPLKRSTSLPIDAVTSYRIRGLRKGQLYEVRIAALTVNGTGKHSEWYRVTTRENNLDESRVPDQPVAILVQPRSTSALIGWRPPVNRGIVVRGYVIQYGHANPYANRVQLEGAQELVYEIRGLKANTRYVAMVKAYNTKGEGKPAYKDFQTLENSDDEPDTKPLTPPIYIRANPVGSRTIRVQWDEQLETNLRRLTFRRSYTVRFAAITGKDTTQMQYKFKNTSEKHLTLVGLQPNTEYEISVRVTVGSRASVWSMKTNSRTMPSKPSSAPRDLTVLSVGGTGTSLLLNWQPPKIQNGIITHYLVIYSSKSTMPLKDWPSQKVAGDALSARITHLRPNTIYYIRIQAVNRLGSGPFSQKIAYKTGNVVGKGGELMKPAYQGGMKADREISDNLRKFEPDNTGLKMIDEFAKASSETTTKAPENMEFSHIMYAIIGGLVGLLWTLVCIVIVVLYRRRKRRARTGKHNEKPRQQLKPPDLWIHDRNLELTRLENNSECDPMLGSSTMSSRDRSSSDRNRHSFIESSLTSPLDEEQRFMIRTNRMMDMPNRMNVESPHHFMDQGPVSVSPGLLTQSQSSLRPYKQYPSTQYAPSAADNNVISVKPMQSHHNHVPMKIPLINPLKCPALAVQTPHAPPENEQKVGRSTEDLSAEMANLEGVMKDLQTALNHNNEIFM